MSVATLSLAAVFTALSGSMTPVDEAKALVNKMTPDEKLGLLHGHAGPAVGNTIGCPRLGIPPMFLEDGPNGVADGVRGATQWPSSLAIAATWDTQIAHDYGDALGLEQRGKGMNVMLGPGVNLARVPVGGRNFEYFGEDPHLAATLSAQEVRGIQGQHVIACAKHFVDNNAEGPGHNGRLFTSSVVTERAQRELYYPAFQGAIDAGVGSIMCSYNLINGTYSCENNETISDLKQDLGFDGFLVSDWGATHDPATALAAGMDMEQSGSFTAAAVASVATARIDDAAVRVVSQMIAVGVINSSLPFGNVSNVVTSSAHRKLAQHFAEASLVLVKNANGLLPLNVATWKTLGVVGDANTVGGGGSGAVISSVVVTPTDGIRAYLHNTTAPTNTNTDESSNRSTNSNSNSNKTLTTIMSSASAIPKECASFHADAFISGFDLGPAPWGHKTSSPTECCVLCSQTAGCAFWSWNPGSPGTCYPKTIEAANHSTLMKGYAWGSCPQHPPAPPPSPPPPPYECAKAGPVTVCNHSIATTLPCGLGQCPQSKATPIVTDDDITASVMVAKLSGVVVVSVAVRTSEGYDRDNLTLGEQQDRLISQVAANTEHVVVVVRAPGAILMPWLSEVDAVIVHIMPGQEAGAALARVLFGAVSPVGKLPLSFPKTENDTWLQEPSQYPGTPPGPEGCGGGCSNVQTYSEGLLMGYRWYDAKGTTPLFPFGHGLSYTTFSYHNLSISPQTSQTPQTSRTSPILSTSPTSASASVSALVLSSSSWLITFTVSNIGNFAGAEVAQMYIAMPVAAESPPKQLRGFYKTKVLAAGASSVVTMVLKQSDLSIWSSYTHAWEVKEGAYTVIIGASSRDIRLNQTIQVS